MTVSVAAQLVLPKLDSFVAEAGQRSVRVVGLAARVVVSKNMNLDFLPISPHGSCGLRQVCGATTAARNFVDAGFGRQK